MAALSETACPACKAAAGTLMIVEKLIANPLGSYSLSGAQMKVSARSRLVLTCSKCSLHQVGDYTPDGHAEFF